MVAAAPLPVPRALMTAQPDSLQLELVAQARVRAGQSVRFTLRIRNQTAEAVDLYLRGRTPTFDLVVQRVTGEVVWRRLEDEIIPAIVHLRVLKPDERLDLTTTWDQRTRAGSLVAAGNYTARALLLVEGEALEAPPVRFDISEP